MRARLRLSKPGGSGSDPASGGSLLDAVRRGWRPQEEAREPVPARGRRRWPACLAGPTRGLTTKTCPVALRCPRIWSRSQAERRLYFFDSTATSRPSTSTTRKSGAVQAPGLSGDGTSRLPMSRPLRSVMSHVTVSSALFTVACGGCESAAQAVFYRSGKRNEAPSGHGAIECS